jgi:hypothetical protein
VLNTEAHPFPRFDAKKKRFKTGWARIPRDEQGDMILNKSAEKTEGEEESKTKAAHSAKSASSEDVKEG